MTDTKPSPAKRNCDGQPSLVPTPCSASFRGASILNADCMDVMSKLADKAYDLAIVDPPYGIERFKKGFGTTRFKMDARTAKNGLKWDVRPSDEYWNELRRVSKNQIIWGANYFPQVWQSPCSGFIYWAKSNPVDNFSDGELAWTSFDRPAKQFNYAWGGLSDGVLGRNKKEKSIHPTQKPVALYKWLLQHYAQAGWRILDTHMGSGSSVIAALDAGHEMLACEIDEQYFAAAVERIGRYEQQGTFAMTPNTKLTHDHR